MNHRRSLLASSLTSLALAASLAPASAAPAPTSPPPTGYQVTIPLATATNPGTSFPRFATQSLSEALASSLRTAQGDSRALLAWGRCPQLQADGSGGALSINHCFSLTLGTSLAQTTYVLIDLACPASSPSAACYGGYVIAGRADATIARDVTAGVTTIDTQNRIRVGYKRKLYHLDGTVETRFVLPSTPALIVDQRLISGASSSEAHVTATDATGTVVVQHDQARIASTASMSCSDHYDQALADGEFWSAAVGTGVTTAVVVGGTAGGIAIAVFGAGATLGAGTAPAILAGTAISGAALGLATVLYTGITDAGDAWARSNAIAARAACERQQLMDEFSPEELADLTEELAAMTSGASDSGLADVMDASACDGSSSGTVTIDGQECYEECTQTWVDGECKTACVTICE